MTPEKQLQLFLGSLKSREEVEIRSKKTVKRTKEMSKVKAQSSNIAQNQAICLDIVVLRFDLAFGV